MAGRWEVGISVGKAGNCAGKWSLFALSDVSPPMRGQTAGRKLAALTAPNMVGEFLGRPVCETGWDESCIVVVRG